MSRGGNGIGLYRSEFLFVGRSGLPTEKNTTKPMHRSLNRSASDLSNPNL